MNRDCRPEAVERSVHCVREGNHFGCKLGWLPDELELSENYESSTCRFRFTLLSAQANFSTIAVTDTWHSAVVLTDAPCDLHIRVTDEHAGTQKLLPLVDVLSSSLDHPIAG